MEINIPKKYLKFFVRQHNESRYILLQGGRRSGKTYSTFQWLVFLCSGKQQYNVMVAAASASQLAATIQDFQDLTGMQVTGNKVYGDHCILPNGSIWQFKNFDEYTKCVGQKCDYLFLNEAVNLDEQSFGTLVQGVREAIYLNYNPTRTCWVDKYIKPDRSNLLITTWQDNPYLTDYQKEEFENIKRRALAPTATVFDKYAYEVFYKGVFTNMAGKVFTQIFTCTDKEFEEIPVQAAFGMDFGWTDGNDETTLVAVKLYDNKLYAKELLYSKGLSNDKQLALTLYNLGFGPYDTIVADAGGMGKTRIYNLCTAGNYEWTEPEISKGYNIVNARKTRIIDGIQEMLNCDEIYVTDSSTHLRLEMDNYELKDGTAKGKDHAIDALRYAFHYSKANVF